MLVFGWGLHFETLLFIRPGFALMVPTTCISFILCGWALLNIHFQHTALNVLANLLTRIAIIAVAGISLTNLAFASFGHSTGLDHILFDITSDNQRAYMSPATAINFLAASICLAIIHFNVPSLQRLYVIITTAGLIIASTALTGYLLDTHALYEVWIFTALALHTAIGFVLLFLALLFYKPTWGWYPIVISNRAGSRIVRRMLPTIAIAPIILAWLALIATRMDLILPNFRLSLVTNITILLLATLLLWNGYLQNIADRKLHQTLKALKRTIGERDLLLSEVHHRVKNNLQQVMALLHLESVKVNDAAAKESFKTMSQRIKSLAIVHGMLIESKTLSKIHVDQFLQDLCPQIADGFLDEQNHIKLEVQVDPEVVELDFAVPLGILVTELITNAFKHAFPNRKDGHIQVNYSLQPDGSVLLQVIDNGIGFSGQSYNNFYQSDISSTNAGTQIVRGLIKQLQATLNVEGTNGTAVAIRIPAGISGDRS